MVPISVPKLVIHTQQYLLRPGERKTLLIIGDFIIGVIALLFSLYLWSLADEYQTFSIEFLQRTPGWFFLLPVVWILLLIELYDDRRSSSWGATLRGVTTAALVGLVFYLFIFFFADNPKTLNRRGVGGFLFGAFFLTLVWRMVYIRIFTAPRFMRRVLLVGAGVTGETMLKVTKEIWPPPFYWVGIIDDDPEKAGTQKEGLPILGNNGQMMEILAKERVSDILVAISGEMSGTMFQSLLDAQEQGIAITRMPVAYEELLGRVPIRHLEADWILRSFIDQTTRSGIYELMKRLLDIAGGLFGTLVFLALSPFIALAIMLDSGRPIFYSQIRLGLGGRPYNIVKFRTMHQNAEADGQPQWAQENDDRATRVGRVLRKTHIDELPQFLSVLRGDMSLVGPRAERPELVNYFQRYVPFYRARLLVKPGITGWAQVNFGYASNIEETIVKLEYDLYYIKRRNLLLDITILLRTPATVFGFRGR